MIHPVEGTVRDRAGRADEHEPDTKPCCRNIPEMEITKDTRVSAILEEYGDIADVMEVFGVKRVGRYSLRMLAAKR
ncbi:MAG: hypothetical protein MZV64_59925 [Ignavibacteriales bacterium]|nr:hypothetical protein [Ignavibacteriales bacterium]